MDLHPINSMSTAVSSVGDGHRGDDVVVQQVHSPPGVVLFICVGA